MGNILEDGLDALGGLLLDDKKIDANIQIT